MNRGLRGREDGQGFCLGNPRHSVQTGEDLCPICGTLVNDVFLGTYQVKRLLGSGRSGMAYLAVQRRQQLPVVVKIFPPDPASRDLWEEARQEANRVATLHHNSILPMISCALWSPKTIPWGNSLNGEVAQVLGKQQYLCSTRQYAPLTLSDLLAVGNTWVKSPILQSGGRLIHLLAQAAGALTFVHSLGIVHGALVPGNFLLSAQLDRLVVTDFGLARLHPPPPPYLAPELSAASNASWYSASMAPYWRAVTAASDQFTFALLCYQLFTRIGLQSALERVVPVIQRATHADPTQRFRDVDTFVNALATALAADLSSLGEAGSGEHPQVAVSSLLPSGSGRMAQRYRLPTPARDAPESLLLPPAPAQKRPVPLQEADQVEQSAGKAFAERDYRTAEQAYLRAVRLDPKRASAWLGLGDTYFALELYNEALGAYGQALSLDANNPEAWFNRATVLDVLGRPDQAAPDYDRAKQLRSEATRNPDL